jgi:D-glycero-alpha-D-manno-heptose-7-phosphate kinase
LIITKTPYRISLFGGGTDYPEWYSKNGGEIISTTIDKYIYISCRELPPFFNHKHRIVYSKIENVKSTNKIKFRVIRKAILSHKINNGLEIHYDGDLPAKSGMGSSSSFSVGLLNAFSTFSKKKITKKELANKSIFFEHKILKEVVGIQDQIAAAYGGFNSIKIFKNGKFIIKPITKNISDLSDLNQNLFLVYTKIKRTAHVVAKSYVKKLSSEKRENMKLISDTVSECKQIFIKKRFDEIGPLLNQSWMAKKNLSSIVSNKNLDEIYNYGIKSGATGGKILGAGGGGIFLFYVPKKNHKNFNNNFKNKLIIPFRFSFEGSKILLK